MNDDVIARLQASALLGYALAYDQDKYIKQLHNLSNAELVVNELCKRLARTIDPERHAEFSEKLLSSVANGISRYQD